jgi:hypothetical protein
MPKTARIPKLISLRLFNMVGFNFIVGFNFDHG